MVKLTPTESQALDQITNSIRSYGNPTWACECSGKVSGKRLSGAMSSLSKKCVIRCEGRGKDSTVELLSTPRHDP